MASDSSSYRIAFADFLERLAVDRTSDTEWRKYVVTHYADEFLEEIRRCVVRLFQDTLPIHSKTEAGNAMLESWAIAIRSSVNAGDVGEQILPANRNVPNGFWVQCQTCNTSVSRREFESLGGSCPECHN